MWGGGLGWEQVCRAWRTVKSPERLEYNTSRRVVGNEVKEVNGCQVM